MPCEYIMYCVVYCTNDGSARPVLNVSMWDVGNNTGSCNKITLNKYSDWSWRLTIAPRNRMTPSSVCLTDCPVAGTGECHPLLTPDNTGVMKSLMKWLTSTWKWQQHVKLSCFPPTIHLAEFRENRSWFLKIPIIHVVVSFCVLGIKCISVSWDFWFYFANIWGIDFIKLNFEYFSLVLWLCWRQFGDDNGPTIIFGPVYLGHTEWENEESITIKIYFLTFQIKLLIFLLVYNSLLERNQSQSFYKYPQVIEVDVR